MRGQLRTLNLYNIVAILLPGVALLILLFPLFPKGVQIDPILAVVPLFATGFLLGQAMHSFAVTVDSYRGDRRGMTLHRELFVGLFCSDISEPEDESLRYLADEFVHAYNRDVGSVSSSVHHYTIDDHDPPLGVSEHYASGTASDFSPDRQNTLGTVSMAYSLVRSKIHTDGRGRSRVFQSVYAFNRSIAYSLPLIIIAYVLYPIVIAFELPQQVAESAGVEQIDYQPVIADFLTPPALVGVLGLIVGGALFAAFVKSTGGYRKYYIQYTLADYLVLNRTDSEGDSAGTPARRSVGGGSGQQSPPDGGPQED